jgi:hypothetical protein
MVSLSTDALAIAIGFGVKPRNPAHLPASHLREGMVLAENLLNDQGGLILPLGTRLTATAVDRLQKLVRTRKVTVCVPDARA